MSDMQLVLVITATAGCVAGQALDVWSTVRITGVYGIEYESAAISRWLLRRRLLWPAKIIASLLLCVIPAVVHESGYPISVALGITGAAIGFHYGIRNMRRFPLLFRDDDRHDDDLTLT